MKKNVRIIINILMFLCLITLMGYHITNNLIHEIIGTVAFVLFIVHNISNIKWYSSIFKGKHDAKRNFHIAINLLLLIAMICTIISGGLMSKSVFTFINIKGTAAMARSVHLIANSWTLVLASIHLGLHLTPITMKLKPKIKESSFEYGIYILLCVAVLIGIYTFINQGIFNDMFGITKFKYFDYEENPVIFYLKYLDMALTISFITNFIINIKKKGK